MKWLTRFPFPTGLKPNPVKNLPVELNGFALSSLNCKIVDLQGKNICSVCRTGDSTVQN